MRPIIEFCTNNMHHGTEKIMKDLERNKDYDVIEYGCLGIVVNVCPSHLHL